MLMHVLLFILSASVIMEMETGDGRIVLCFDLSGRVRVLLRSLGVSQQWTCDGDGRLAAASYGRRATLLSHVLLAVLPPVWRIFNSGWRFLRGAGPSGSSPVPV